MSGAAHDRLGHSEPPGAPWSILAAGPPAWDEAEQAWIVTRYADVQRLLRDDTVEAVEVHPGIERIARRSGRDFESLALLLSGILMFRNPPVHGPRRALLRQSLAAIGDGLSEAAIDAAVATILDAVPHGTEIDAVPALADRLPVRVMARALGLGEDTIQVLHANGRGVVDGWQRGMPLRRYAELERQAAAVVSALLSEVGRARDGDGPLARVLALNAAGPALDDRTLVATLFFFLMAGIETTAGALGSSLFFALSDPGRAARLRAEPGHVRPFVEEVLRYAPAFRRISARRLRMPIRLRDAELPAGCLALPHIEAAHHDPEAFADPGAFRPGRPGPPLLVFGGGAHACLGGHVVRLEMRAMLNRVLGCERVGLVDTAPDWDPHPAFRRLRRLRMVWGRRPRERGTRS